MIKENRPKYLYSFITSLCLHALGFIGFVLVLPKAEYPEISKSDKQNIRLFIHTPKPQIIEARLNETPTKANQAYLGHQNHKTNKESKLPSRPHKKGADATNRLKTAGPIASTSKEAGQGKSRYLELLPSHDSSSSDFHDLIIDPKIPESDILDVNTAQFDMIGYFTAVRKMVDFAFYDPRSSLRNEPRIQKKLVQSGQVMFKGYSQAKLTVERSGIVSNVEILASSDDTELNNTWIKILNLAAPFPPLPPYFKEDKLVFSYTLYYDITVRGDRLSRRYHF